MTARKNRANHIESREGWHLWKSEAFLIKVLNEMAVINACFNPYSALFQVNFDTFEVFHWNLNSISVSYVIKWVSTSNWFHSFAFFSSCFQDFLNFFDIIRLNKLFWRVLNSFRPICVIRLTQISTAHKIPISRRNEVPSIFAHPFNWTLGFKAEDIFSFLDVCYHKYMVSGSLWHYFVWNLYSRCFLELLHKLINRCAPARCNIKSLPASQSILFLSI